jgi:hypothetical protein
VVAGATSAEEATGATGVGKTIRGATTVAVEVEGASSGEETLTRRDRLRGKGRLGRTASPESDSRKSGPVFPELPEGVADIGGATTEDDTDDCDADGKEGIAREAVRAAARASPSVTPSARSLKTDSTPYTKSGESGIHAEVANEKKRARASSITAITTGSDDASRPALAANSERYSCAR